MKEQDLGLVIFIVLVSVAIYSIKWMISVKKSTESIQKSLTKLIELKEFESKNLKK